MIHVNHNGKRFKVSTNESIETNLWDIKNERVKKSCKLAAEKNATLGKLTAKVEEVIALSKIQNYEVTAKLIKEKFIEFRYPEKMKKVDVTFMQHFDAFIKGRESDPNFSVGITKVYHATYVKLTDYEAENRIVLHFDMIDEEFYLDFTDFLIVKGLHNNGIGKHMKTLKTFLKIAFENGLTKNPAFMKFKVWKHEPETIALNDEELHSIETLDLSKNNRLNNSRNLFLLQIYSGLRYGDLKSIKPETINLKDNTIEILTKKTEDRVLLPLTKKIKLIIDQYEGYILPFISNQKQNVYIKEIGSLAGITQNVELIRFQGNVRESTIKPKNKLLSTHTARRTFITQTLLRGILPELVMKVSGHRDRKSFQRYVRITQNEAVEAVRGVWE